MPSAAKNLKGSEDEHCAYSFSDKPYGLPGSYRLPFTPIWPAADHLGLKAGNAEAMRVLLGSHGDGGIITEGLDPTSAIVDHDCRAFATAGDYVAVAICKAYRVDKH